MNEKEEPILITFSSEEMRAIAYKKLTRLLQLYETDLKYIKRELKEVKEMLKAE